MTNKLNKLLKKENISFDWRANHQKIAQRNGLKIIISEPGRLIMKGKANQ